MFDHDNKSFCSVYEGAVLWKVIPWLMRLWWIESLRNFGPPDFPYSNITIESPAPILLTKQLMWKPIMMILVLVFSAV